MTTNQTHTKERELRTNLSKYHDGQIVTPMVTAKIRKDGSLYVQLYWSDASDKTRTKPEIFTRPTHGFAARRAADKWLHEKGVSMDLL